MSRGPLEYIIIEFPGNQFRGEIMPALQELVTSHTIRILDLTFVKKDKDGNVASVELSALHPDEKALFQGLEGEINGLLSDEDIQLAGEQLAPDTSAGMLVWENVWATRFISAVVDAHGQVLAHERIPHDVFEAALTAAQAHPFQTD